MLCCREVIVEASSEGRREVCDECEMRAERGLRAIELGSRELLFFRNATACQEASSRTAR